MDYQYFIGVAIPKRTLDFTVLKRGNYLLHEQTTNTKASIWQWLKKVTTEHRARDKKL